MERDPDCKTRKARKLVAYFGTFLLHVRSPLVKLAELQRLSLRGDRHYTLYELRSYFDLQLLLRHRVYKHLKHVWGQSCHSISTRRPDDIS